MSSKKLILTVTADTKQAVEGFKEVSASIKGLFTGAQGAGAGVAAGALKAFDGVKGALQGIAPVASAVLDVAEKGIEMAQFAGQRQTLLRQVGGDAIESLRASTRGLVDDQTLLKTAAKGMQGDFALTAEQMQDVAAAAVTLHNRLGVDVGGTMAEMTEAMSTGQTDALKKYGISLGETGTQAEKLGRAHEAMASLAASADNKLTDAGTAVTQMLVTMKNAWDTVKEVLGVTVDLIARGFNVLSDATHAVGDFIGKSAAWIVSLGDLGDANDEVYTSIRGVTTAQQDAETTLWSLNRAVSAGASYVANFGHELNQLKKNVDGLLGIRDLVTALTELPGQLNDPMTGIMPKWKKAQEEAKRLRAEEMKDWQDFVKSEDAVMDHRLRLVKDYEDAEKHAAEMTFEVWKDVSESINDNLKKRREDFQSALFPIANQNRVDPGIKRLQDMAKEAYGAKAAFTDLGHSASKALGDLGAAAGTSLQSIISGNAAAYVGLEEMFRTLIDQLGTEMQIQAIKYTALGIANAFFDPAASANYFAAAGVFEAGAIAAGITERNIGAPTPTDTGAKGGSGRGGSGNTAGRDAAGSSTGGSVTVIHQYYIDGFIGDEARLARKMEEMRRRAELAGVTRARAGARRT